MRLNSHHRDVTDVRKGSIDYLVWSHKASMDAGTHAAERVNEDVKRVNIITVSLSLSLTLNVNGVTSIAEQARIRLRHSSSGDSATLERPQQP